MRLAAAGANIVGARITTCHDGTVLDVFFLQDMNNQAIEDVDELARIRKILEQSLTGAIKLEQLLKRPLETNSNSGAANACAIARAYIKQNQHNPQCDRGEWA